MASVVAQRLLCLHNWAVDVSSIHKLTKLPFRGKLLFGADLENLVKELGVAKPVKLPEDMPKAAKDTPNARSASWDFGCFWATHFVPYQKPKYLAWGQPF